MEDHDPGRLSSLGKALALYLALIEKRRDDESAFWKIEALLREAEGILRSHHVVLEEPFLSQREARRLLRDLAASFGGIDTKRGPQGGYRLRPDKTPFPVYSKDEVLALNLLAIRNPDGTDLLEKISGGGFPRLL